MSKKLEALLFCFNVVLCVLLMLKMREIDVLSLTNIEL